MNADVFDIQMIVCVCVFDGVRVFAIGLLTRYDSISMCYSCPLVIFFVIIEESAVL